MKRIKIIHLVSDLSIGGIASIVIDLCNQAETKNYDVNIICLSNNVSMLNQKPLNGNISLNLFDYFFDPDYSLKRYLFLLLNKRIAKERALPILNKVSEISPDIVHFHVLPRELQIGLFLESNIKLIYTDHLKRIGNNDYRLLNREVLKLIYRNWYKSYNVISVSKSVERSNRTNGFLSSKKIHQLIENKISTHTLPNKKLDPNYINVIYIARLSIVKEHYTLLKAWHRLGNKHNFKLWLIGDGELEDDLKRYEKKHIDNNSINFTGAVKNVYDYISSADIGVFPSKKEGLPLALLEQITSGVPMVVSDIEELTDIITHGENGLVFQLGNDTDLYEKLKLLLKTEKLRRSMGLNVQEMAIKRFTEGLLIDHYQTFYKELMNS